MFLWPSASEPKAHSNFHSLMYRFRRALPENSVPFDEVVYQFAPPDGFTYDVAEFQALIDKASTAQSEDEAIVDYEKAVSLYSGDFLEDLYADWIEPYRRSLRDLFLMALSRVAHHHAHRGRIEMAVTVAHRWLHAEPVDESAHRLLMRCYAEQGNTSAVRRQFRQCKELLSEELGVEPEEETVELYQALTSDP